MNGPDSRPSLTRGTPATLGREWLPPRNSPCPCGSGVKTKKCMNMARGPHPCPISLVIPSGGYRNPKCYLGDLGGCSNTISREHYFSRWFLERLGSGRAIELSNFQGQGRVVPLSVENLSAKVLCSAHNAALSAVDQVAKSSIGEIEDALSVFGSGSTVAPTSWRACSGDDLERWLLEV